MNKLYLRLFKFGTFPILVAIAAINLIHLGIHDTFLDMGSLDAGINQINFIAIYLLDRGN